MSITLLNSVLGILFAVIAIILTFLMFTVWRYPFDHQRHESKAPAWMVRSHRVAESEGHHPSILLEFGRVTLTWWTHKINGLHVNDFIMVARSDDLVQ